MIARMHSFASCPFLKTQSVTFKTTSRNLARAMCMKNLKLTIIVIIAALVSKT